MIIKRTLAGIVLAGALAFSGCERKIEEDQLRQEQVQNKSQKEVVVHTQQWKDMILAYQELIGTIGTVQ